VKQKTLLPFFRKKSVMQGQSLTSPTKRSGGAQGRAIAVKNQNG